MTIDNRGWVSGVDETVLIPDSDASVALAHYRLRAAAHRIATDCERVLGELSGTTRQSWREAAGKALLAAQHLRSLIEVSRAPRTGPGARPALDALQASIRDPRQKIVDAMSALLALIPTDVEEEMIMQDARAIRDATLGLFAPEAPAPNRATPAPAGAAQGRASDAKARVLVADDEEALRRHLSRMLERLGYEPILAKNGREALELAERDPPDLIITDLSMPEMTGHELLARRKTSAKTQHIPVIVVSGEGDSDSVVKCLEAGAEDHLAKPYEKVVLQARIRTSLERKRMRDQELAYLRRVAQLTAAAEAVERQSYDSGMLEDVRLQEDQLGQLARVFDRMMTGIRSREAQLEARVRQLRRRLLHLDRKSTRLNSS